jgi:septum formation topological specificity factor MinE
VGSSPTPGALVVDSYKDLNNLKKDKSNDSLQNSLQSRDNTSEQKKERINELVIAICKYQRSFIRKSLDKLLEISPANTEIICKYIIAEQNEINIKESTKEGKIKVLIDLVKFLDFKRIIRHKKGRYFFIS